MQELVSILIPAYKDANTLQRAVESCLSQTYGNIEVLVLNNGSPDHSAEVLAGIQDSRLHVLHESENLGIAPARNKLLQAAKGSFIAWLDADDHMLPERIEKQMDYMRQHPETDVLGSWIMTDDPTLEYKRLPLSHSDICICLWFKNCLVQPSILSRNFYRSENIFYDESYTNSVEDYELWYRLSSNKTFANQADYLTVYHVTRDPGLGVKKRDNGFERNLDRLWTEKWKAIPFELHPEDKALFQAFLYSNRKLQAIEVQSLSKTLKMLATWKTDSMFSLIIALHRLRLFRLMGFSCKLKHLHWLFNLLRYREMKKKYLI